MIGRRNRFVKYVKNYLKNIVQNVTNIIALNA